MSRGRWQEGESGQPRKDTIPRMQRECSKHGMTEHSKYKTVSGNKNPYGQWQCMLCNTERARRRNAKYREEGHVATPRVEKVEAPPSCCPVHFIALPVTGVCEECE